MEYGSSTIEMHKDAVKEGDRVLVIDDLLATGGTAIAACKLLRRAGAEVDSTAFIIELYPLKGREKLKQYDVRSVVSYEGK